MVEFLKEKLEKIETKVPETIKDHQADVIRRIIYESYKKNMVLTLNMLRDEVNKSLNIYCTKTTVWRFIKKIGFCFQKINKRQVIIESSRSWRRMAKKLLKGNRKS